jgi:hypothetical protein
LRLAHDVDRQCGALAHAAGVTHVRPPPTPSCPAAAERPRRGLRRSPGCGAALPHHEHFGAFSTPPARASAIAAMLTPIAGHHLNNQQEPSSRRSRSHNQAGRHRGSEEGRHDLDDHGQPDRNTLPPPSQGRQRPDHQTAVIDMIRYFTRQGNPGYPPSDINMCPPRGTYPRPCCTTPTLPARRRPREPEVRRTRGRILVGPTGPYSAQPMTPPAANAACGRSRQRWFLASNVAASTLV